MDVVLWLVAILGILLGLCLALALAKLYLTPSKSWTSGRYGS